MLPFLLIFCSHLDGGAACQTIAMPSQKVCVRIGNAMMDRAKAVSSNARPKARCESMKP